MGAAEQGILRAVSELLKAGMCLVDTPGLGSVLIANTEATRAFVPHVDAALLVGADPPITGDELALVRAMAETVRDIIVVFKKTDRQPDIDRTEAIRRAMSVSSSVVSSRQPIRPWMWRGRRMRRGRRR